MARFFTVAFLFFALVATAMAHLRQAETKKVEAFTHKVAFAGCGGAKTQLVCRALKSGDKLSVKGNLFESKSVENNKVSTSVIVQSISFNAVEASASRH